MTETSRLLCYREGYCLAGPAVLSLTAAADLSYARAINSSSTWDSTRHWPLLSPVATMGSGMRESLFEALFLADLPRD